MASFLSSLFGSKPSLPPLPELNLGTEQSKAAANNLAVAPAAGKIASFTSDQILNMMRSVVPNFDQITGSVSKNIASELKGELPQDVQDKIQSSVAASNLASGTAGTGLGRNLTAKDLGLVSLDLTEKGLSSAESWMASTERLLAPATAELTSMFVTPAQQAAFDVEERNAQYNRQYLQNQINAMPDPITSGLFNLGMKGAGAVVSAFGIPGMGAATPAANSGTDFAFSSATNDMFDSGFDYSGGSNLMNVMGGQEGNFGAGWGEGALNLA